MKHLVIGPGAIGFFALMGALNRMHEEGSLKDLESLSGSSAGALLVCMTAVYNFDFKKMLWDSTKVPIHKLKPQIKSLFESYGLVPPETIKELVRTCIPDITFKELLERFPIKIHLAAYCVELSQTHYFSADTHPDMSIVDAVCMSISVPLLFSSFKHGPWTYFDGAAAETAPCGHLEHIQDVHILRLRYKETFMIEDLTSYIQLVFRTFMKLRKSYTRPTMYIDLGTVNIMNFQADNIQKLTLFTQGYNFFVTK
jgi:NTE family protein